MIAQASACNFPPTVGILLVLSMSLARLFYVGCLSLGRMFEPASATHTFGPRSEGTLHRI
jgi:hypothetical protein